MQSLDAFRPASATSKRNGCRPAVFRYIIRVNHLTRQEMLVLGIILGLLLTGLLVKTYRTAHPPVIATQTQTP
jgi:hypothetical protein